MKPTEKILTRIASELELGLRVFVHRGTGELIAVPTEQDLDDRELWEAELDRIEAAPGEFVVFRPIDPTEAFAQMEAFAASLTDAPFGPQLQAALQQPRPFQQFHTLVNVSGNYRERWLRFQQEAGAQRVRTLWAALLP